MTFFLHSCWPFDGRQSEEQLRSPDVPTGSRRAKRAHGARTLLAAKRTNWSDSCLPSNDRSQSTEGRLLFVVRCGGLLHDQTTIKFQVCRVGFWVFGRCRRFWSFVDCWLLRFQLSNVIRHLLLPRISSCQSTVKQVCSAAPGKQAVSPIHHSSKP